MDIDVVFYGGKTFDFDRATVIAISGGLVATVLKVVVGYLDIRVVGADSKSPKLNRWKIIEEDQVVDINVVVKGLLAKDPDADTGVGELGIPDDVVLRIIVEEQGSSKVIWDIRVVGRIL